MKHTQTKHKSYSSDELIGRALLEEIIPTIYANKEKYNYHYYISDIADTTRYDAFVSIFEIGGQLKANHIIEVKVRDIHYDEMMLEKRKYDELKAVLKREYNVADIIYINTTPKGTFIWNVTKLEEQQKIKWETKLCNKSTVQDKGKIEKRVTLLPINKAKHIPHITNTFLEQKLKEKEEKIQEKVKEKQREKCLYQWLLTPSQLCGEIKRNGADNNNDGK